MASVTPLRLAFLGCGFITRVHSRPPAVAPRRRRSRLTPAVSARRPTTTAGGSTARGSYGDYDAAIDDPSIDAVVDRGAAAISPRAHAAGAGGGQARAGREAGVPDDGGLRDGAGRRAIAPAEWCSSARTITTSRWPSACASSLRRRRDRRDGVRALHDAGQETEDGRRLAQRRNDGRRRRLLRGRHPLAAPRRQPRSAHRRHSRLSPVGLARPGRTRARRA